MISHFIRPFRGLISSILLFSWLFATGAILIEHGGAIGPGYFTEAKDHSARHEGPGHEAHSHDLATTSRPTDHQIAPSPIPVAPLDNSILELTVAQLREVENSQTAIELTERPSDEGSSVWLIVCRTASPVRAPSPAA